MKPNWHQFIIVKKLKKKPVALGALLHGGEAIPSHCSLGRLTASLGFIRLVKAMVFPVVMYGCESRTVKKAERQRIDAFEL